MKIKLTALSMLIFLVLCGCSSATSSSNIVNFTEKVNVTQKNISSPKTYSPLFQFSDKLLAGSFNTYDYTNENFVISPTATYIAISALSNGAYEETADELLPLIGTRLSSANIICLNVQSKANSYKSDTFDMSLHSSIWIDRPTVLKKDYLKAVASSLNTTVYGGILSKWGETAINSWLSESSNGRLSSFDAYSLSDDTSIIMFNTFCLNGAWLNEFSPNNTLSGDFTLQNGEIVQAVYLNDYNCRRNYTSTNQADVVVLPYKGGKVAFIAALPKDGISALELAKQLSAEDFKQFVGYSPKAYINVMFPKFTVETTFSLRDCLYSLGLSNSFSEQSANFPYISSSSKEYVTDVLQGVCFSVGEQGTESLSPTDSQSGEPVLADITINFNKPFVYSIVDIENGTPLIIGIMNNPN